MNHQINLITYLHMASNDIELTPIFYTNSMSGCLFFRFQYFSKTISGWMLKDDLEDWQHRAKYDYQLFINHNHYWWRIDEASEGSIAEFLNQFYITKTCFEAMGIKIKDCSERIYMLEQDLKNLRYERINKENKIGEIDCIIEKAASISRNDIITIYEMAAQCCSAYNNLIMLIDKKNISKYVAYAKGAAKQSQYTQDIAEAKYWTDKIMSFTKPMADFCESMNELYDQTQGIEGKFGKWDSQQPYGKAMDFPLLTQSIYHLQRLAKQFPEIIQKGEDKAYIDHCKKMSSRQRIY